ncbi:MAG: hypothetical protein DCF22_04250 [Leptolyngbya sp.]|nr:MAG: hypothetical protein DCF22_04250 [Leptolyngbya sp.]
MKPTSGAISDHPRLPHLQTNYQGCLRSYLRSEQAHPQAPGREALTPENPHRRPAQFCRYPIYHYPIYHYPIYLYPTYCYPIYLYPTY